VGLIIVARSLEHSGEESGANYLSAREHYGGHHLRRGSESYPAREKQTIAI